MDNYIINIYANVIQKKLKTIEEVPEEIREQVAFLLNNNEESEEQQIYGMDNYS